MTSNESPYSIVYPFEQMLEPWSQSSAWECHRPKLCPMSWLTSPLLGLPLIHAYDGLPPTVPSPAQPQPPPTKAYTNRRYVPIFAEPTSAVAACFAYDPMAP